MTIGKLMLALAIGGATYAMCSEKTQKQVKKTAKCLSKSVHDLGDEAMDKVGDKVLKEKAQHA